MSVTTSDEDAVAVSYADPSGDTAPSGTPLWPPFA
jgi:hypothetical protein